LNATTRERVKIERAVLREVPLKLADPFQSSAGLVSERRVLILTLHCDGIEGWSECVAPGTPHYTYETTDTAWHVLTDFMLPKVVGVTLEEPQSVLAELADVRGHPMAKAAVEMAAWDAVARARAVSIAELLGGRRNSVPAGVSLGMMPSERLGDVIERYLRDGYARVKVKIGPGRDVTVLEALRARFPDLALWADANSAYSLADLPLLQSLDGLDLELLEEPIAAGDLVGCARLQDEIGTPICLDESIGSASDTATALALGSCRIVNLKPGRVGGFGPSLAIYEMLQEASVPVWCGGMLESGIGRAHNLALAYLPGFELPGDISASRRYWERDIVSPEFDVVDGEVAVPKGPGIGVAVDVERIQALTVRTAEFG
jgi:O-succinylbenzoate synthase